MARRRAAIEVGSQGDSSFAAPTAVLLDGRAANSWPSSIPPGPATGRARIELVNRTINSAIRYTSDYAQHGVADLWSSPLATLASGRGDCEDYAIAKYVVLREAGVPAADMRLLLVHDRAVRQDHAVLAVLDNGRWIVLDNRHPMLLETASLPQFTPLFALDHQGVSLFASPYACGRRRMPGLKPCRNPPRRRTQAFPGPLPRPHALSSVGTPCAPVSTAAMLAGGSVDPDAPAR